MRMRRTRMGMSLQTVGLLALAAVQVAGFFLFPPLPYASWYSGRARFMALFATVAVFCVSWIFDEWKSRY